jgi:hypothetical protein
LDIETRLISKRIFDMKKIFIAPYKGYKGVWNIRYEGENTDVALCETLDIAKEQAKIYAAKRWKS